MKILVSNDDGYFSPGIAALATAISTMAEVFVIAPERDRSGASNSLTLDRPLMVRSAANGYRYLNGTPTDCVHVAITGLLGFRPDLVVSGINDGANMGDDTIYSGTVAAAMEGYLLGVPGIAFSLVTRGWAGLDTAAAVARDVVLKYAPRLIARPMLLNVNIPNVPYAELAGIELTRLGKRHVSESVIRSTNPKGETVYWIGPAGGVKDAGPGTDFHAVLNRRVSMTPLDVDLTNTDDTPELARWLQDEAPA